MQKELKNFIDNELILSASKSFNKYKKLGGKKSITDFKDTIFREILQKYANDIYRLNIDKYSLQELKDLKYREI